MDKWMDEVWKERSSEHLGSVTSSKKSQVGLVSLRYLPTSEPAYERIRKKR